VSGRAGVGTTTKIRFAFEEQALPVETNGAAQPRSEELALQIPPGEVARPVIARVIGALAARAEFSVERLSDTVLIGDAVSAHTPEDFPEGLATISIRDGSGTLSVRVGPMVEGGGDRILSAMDLPGGGGSLRGLAGSMDVVREDDGEYLEFEVSS
jgi:hypothetical protein